MIGKKYYNAYETLQVKQGVLKNKHSFHYYTTRLGTEGNEKIVDWGKSLSELMAKHYPSNLQEYDTLAMINDKILILELSLSQKIKKWI